MCDIQQHYRKDSKLAILSDTEDRGKKVLHKLDETAQKAGLKISYEKMTVKNTSTD